MVIMEYIKVIMFIAYFFPGEPYPLVIQREVTYEECYQTHRAALEYGIMYPDEDYRVMIECINHPADKKAQYKIIGDDDGI